jgi:hypothetical protein
MNCNCVTEVEKQLANHMKPQAGDDAKATCQATVFQITSTLRLMLQIPFRVKGSKKGFTSANGKEVPVTASHCPFCGRDAREGRYTVGQDEGLAAVFGKEVAHG